MLCPFNGAFRQPVANDRPTRYIIDWGRPTDEYREKKYCLTVHMVIGWYYGYTRTVEAGFLQKKKKIKNSIEKN